MKISILTIAALLCAALAGCSDEGPKSGSETHWLTCQQTADCNDGFVCSAGRCLPEDEVNNGTTGTNNASTSGTTGTSNSSNNATNNTNNSTTVTNNTVGDAMCPALGVPVPAELPSDGTVFFDVTNDSAVDWWVPTMGWFCDGWEVVGVSRSVGFRCGCECPNPGSAHVEQYTLVPAGDALEFQWDGRGLEQYDDCVECGDFGGGPITERTGALQPVAPGTYEIRLNVLETLPPRCTDGGGVASCDDLGGDGTPGDIAMLCPADDGSTMLSASFDIPAAPYSFRVSVGSL